MPTHKNTKPILAVNVRLHRKPLAWLELVRSPIGTDGINKLLASGASDLGGPSTSSLLHRKPLPSAIKAHLKMRTCMGDQHFLLTRLVFSSPLYTSLSTCSIENKNLQKQKFVIMPNPERERETLNHHGFENLLLSNRS